MSEHSPTTPHTVADKATRYAEGLRVPIWWWLVCAFFLLSVWVAAGFYLQWLVGGLITAVCTAIVAAVLIGYGATRTVVDAQGLLVGRSRLEWRWIGSVQALDPEATRLRLGREADPRAWLVVRPWLKRAVLVAVDDAADPHPYWLISSARPDELARALTVGSQVPPKEEPR